jgi:hypothetical protein
MGFDLDKSLFPDEKQQFKFCKSYLEYYKKKDVMDEKVRHFMKEVGWFFIYYLFLGLFWRPIYFGVYGLFFKHKIQM